MDKDARIAELEAQVARMTEALGHIISGAYHYEQQPTDLFFAAATVVKNFAHTRAVREEAVRTMAAAYYYNRRREQPIIADFKFFKEGEDGYENVGVTWPESRLAHAVGGHL